jgi:prepilin-type N-terminal cleavage/methylation domain-containing protein
MKRPHARFTLIELLVVVAIISVLASMLLPALSKARDAAKLALCAGNQRQIYLGSAMYAGDQDAYLPDRTIGAFARYPIYGHLAGQVGRYGRVENGQNEALGGFVHNNHFRIMGPFLDDYFGMQITYSNGGDNLTLTNTKNPFICPNGIFADPPPGISLSPTNHAAVDYFFAGFGAHQYRFTQGPPINAYPFALPRLDRMNELNGAGIAFLADYMNHPGRMNMTSHDGATQRFAWAECYPFYAVAGAFTYMPKGYATAFMGHKAGNDYYAEVVTLQYNDGDGARIWNEGALRMEYFGY